MILRILKFLFCFCSSCLIIFVLSQVSFAQNAQFIRITGGPIFYDELTSSNLDKTKWEVWPIEYEEKKYLSYQTNLNGFSILSSMDCFSNFNFYGIVSMPIRGLVGISLVTEVEISDETKYLPGIVHLCNCCSEFSDFEQDDFWCDANLDKGGYFYFICNEINKFKKLLPESQSKLNEYKNKAGTSSGKYLVKLEQSSRDYSIKAYVKPFKANSKYELIGSTTHPYPLSQAKVELKTYTINCNEKNDLKKLSKVATFKKLRVYKSPKNNPLFIRVIDKDGLGVRDYKVKFTVTNLSGKNNIEYGITDQNGYATLKLSKLSVQEYPIADCNVQVLSQNSLLPLFNKNFKMTALQKGIYPGDFWQINL